MNNFPKAIKSENDLNAYSDYLQRQTNPPNTKNSHTIADLIGSIVKIDSVIGNRVDSKNGVLISFDGTFLGLRQPQTGKTVFCNVNSVKYVTVMSNGKITR